MRRAWIAHFHHPSQGEAAHTLLAIEASGNFDALAAETGLVARDITIPDPPLDIMAIAGGGGIEDYFVRQTKPFYERRFLGLF